MIHHAKQESSSAFCQYPHQLLGRGCFRALVSAPEEQQWHWMKRHFALPSVHFSRRDDPRGRFLEHVWLPRAALGTPRNPSALGSRTSLGLRHAPQDAEGKGYGAAAPFGAILLLAQWKQEVPLSWEEAIRNHSPSRSAQPTFCYLLHSAIRQNTGGAREGIKKRERMQRRAGHGCQKRYELLQSRHECITHSSEF